MTNYEKLQQSMGTDTILLNDVLRWHSMNNRDKDSIFGTFKGIAFFADYKDKEPRRFYWDLEYIGLKVQSENMIDFLVGLI